MKKTLPALICAAFLGTAAQAAQVDIFGAVDMYVGVNNAGGEWIFFNDLNCGVFTPRAKGSDRKSVV